MVEFMYLDNRAILTYCFFISDLHEKIFCFTFFNAIANIAAIRNIKKIFILFEISNDYVSYAANVDKIGRKESVCD